MELPVDPADVDLHYAFDDRVRFAEIDAQGVVFYGEFGGASVDFHVVHTDVDYHARAGFDDELRNGIRVESFGESSIHFAWASRRASDDQVVPTGELSHVAVDAASGEPTRVPDAFRETVREFQSVPPEEA
jgi:acyl-CoA thioester hydrolase